MNLSMCCILIKTSLKRYKLTTYESLGKENRGVLTSISNAVRTPRLVRMKGLEPPRLATREPKSRMSANSITSARRYPSSSVPFPAKAENYTPLLRRSSSMQTHFVGLRIELRGYCFFPLQNRPASLGFASSYEGVLKSNECYSNTSVILLQA